MKNRDKMLFLIHTLLLISNALSTTEYIECHSETHVIPVTETIDYANLGQSLIPYAVYVLPTLLQFSDTPFTKPKRLLNAEAFLLSILSIIDLDEQIDRRKRTKSELQTRLFWIIFNDAVTDHRFPLEVEYSGILAQICNRELVRNMHTLISETEEQLIRPEVAINREVRWAEIQGRVTRVNCFGVLHNAVLQKQMAFLDQALMICRRQRKHPRIITAPNGGRKRPPR